MAYDPVKEHTARRASAETRLEIVLYLLRVLLHDCADDDSHNDLVEVISALQTVELAD